MNRSHLLLSTLVLAGVASAQTGAPAWSSYGRSNTHRANAPTATQNFGRVIWSTPVDRKPQYTGGDVLLIHYGSPVITRNNVICIPVKTGTTDGWIVEGRNGATGGLLYTVNTDFSIPTYPSLNWVASMGPALSPDGRLYVPGAGGTIIRRDNPEAVTSTATRFAFYGIEAYKADKATYNANVKICTPLTIDALGNVYFGFVTYGSAIDRSPVGAAGVLSGIAKIAPNGVGTWKKASEITGDAGATHIAFNCAPALSPDGLAVYVGVKRSGGGGYLVGLNTSTLGLKYLRRLYDPSTGNDAIITDQGSGTPMIGTDGDVFYGVLSNPHSRHNLRGFMLHFDKALKTQKAPGSFGWDITPSMIPTSLVPSYSGPATYLLVSKYNNYAWTETGDGANKIALLDPVATQTDTISGIPVMKEVMTILGPTPDPGAVSTYPNAVYEWCVNSTVLDYARKAALINSEDGRIYRWSFVTNRIDQTMLLDGPRGQAYTPTISGPTGIIYAINNAKLFAIGN